MRKDPAFSKCGLRSVRGKNEKSHSISEFLVIGLGGATGVGIRLWVFAFQDLPFRIFSSLFPAYSDLKLPFFSRYCLLKIHPGSPDEKPKKILKSSPKKPILIPC